MKRRSVLFLLAALALALSLSACADATEGMQDGYYTAEAASFDEYGWKEYITICVSDNKIVMVEYNARNASGFIKSWDMEYMRHMNAVDGTYPNEYARAYMVALLNWQNPSEVDAVSGATVSHDAFQKLAAAAMEQARAGDKRIALIELPGAKEE